MAAGGTNDKGTPDGFEFLEELQPSDSRDLRFQQYLALFLRGKWIVLSTIALAVGLAFAYTLRTRPMYQAASLVLISSKGGQGMGGMDDLVLGGATNKITNELGILKSRLMAEEVAKALLMNPYMDSAGKQLIPIVTADERGSSKLAPQGGVAGRVRGSVTFEPQRESDLIRIVAKRPYPREAAIVANVYAEVYQGQNLRASRTQSRDLREFLESRMTEQRNALTRSEDSVRKFMESAGVASLDGASSDVVSQLSQLEASRNALDIEIQTLAQRLQSYRSELPRQESNVERSLSQAGDPYIRMLQEQIARLEVQRDVTIAQSDPAVLKQDIYEQRLRDINDQIAGLQSNLQRRSRELVQSLLPEGGGGSSSDPVGYLKGLKQRVLETEIDLLSLQSKREALDRILTQYERKFQSIPRKSLDLAKLQRARMSSEKLYLLLEAKYNEAAITEKSEFGYVSIVDRAIPGYAPVSPNMRFNLLFGLIIGLGVGIGIVILREMLDTRVRTPDDLKRRGFVSLTEVAPMGHELRSLNHEKLPPEAEGFQDNVKLMLNPLSFVAESYRRLRTNILRTQLRTPMKTIMVTSPNPYEGKSTTVCNMALAFAETQRRVLLVDADIRRPNIHKSLGIVPRPGLTDLLFSKAAFEDVIRRNVAENLDVVPCGTVIRSPGRLFGGRAMHEFIEKVKEQYDWVFIDAPPILVANDAPVLATMSDAVIFVVTAGTTRMTTLRRATQFLADAGGSLLGVVLNKFDAKKTYGRYYGSHKYGHYENEYQELAPSNGRGKLGFPRKWLAFRKRVS